MHREWAKRNEVRLQDNEVRRSRATAWEDEVLDTEPTELPKWEDLEFDCLVNILGRVGLESLLLDVPFVCRSWCKASLDFSCWQRIDHIPRIHSLDHSCFRRHSQFILRFIDEFRIKVDKFSLCGFMRLLVARGIDKSACVALSRTLRYNDLKMVAEKCPELRGLWLDFWGRRTSPSKNEVKLIEKWKRLEEIWIERTPKITIFKEVVAQIALYCKNLSSLIVNFGYFSKEHALAIVNHLPNIKKLTIWRCPLEQEDLEILLRHFKGLEYTSPKCIVFWVG